MWCLGFKKTLTRYYHIHQAKGSFDACSFNENDVNFMLCTLAKVLRLHAGCLHSQAAHRDADMFSTDENQTRSTFIDILNVFFSAAAHF